MRRLIIFISIIFSHTLYGQQPQNEVQNAQAEHRPRREVTWVNPLSVENEGLAHHILKCKNLGHDVGYVVWTPPAYIDNAKKRFPVIYFLHGSGGDTKHNLGLYYERSVIQLLSFIGENLKK